MSLRLEARSCLSLSPCSDSLSLSLTLRLMSQQRALRLASENFYLSDESAHPTCRERRGSVCPLLLLRPLLQSQALPTSPKRFICLTLKHVQQFTQCLLSSRCDTRVKMSLSLSLSLIHTLQSCAESKTLHVKGVYNHHTCCCCCCCIQSLTLHLSHSLSVSVSQKRGFFDFTPSLPCLSFLGQFSLL